MDKQKVVDSQPNKLSSGTIGASDVKIEYAVNENKELKGKTNHSRQRKRTERIAIEYLDRNLSLPPGKRRKELVKIRAAKQPKRAAINIIKRHNADGLSVNSETVDLSSAQELIVKLIRRDGGIYEPQASLVRRLELDIIGGISRDEFTKAAAVIIGMPQVLPKSFLANEGGPE